MQIETIGDALDHGVRIHMRCAWGKRDGLKSIRACIFRAELDVMTLVCTRGRPFPISMLATRMRCPECRSRRVFIRLEIPDQPARIAASGGK